MEKVVPNQPCPCGSNKSYKKCCLMIAMKAALKSKPMITDPLRSVNIGDFVELFERSGWDSHAGKGFTWTTPVGSKPDTIFKIFGHDGGLIVEGPRCEGGVLILQDGELVSSHPKSPKPSLRMLWRLLAPDSGSDGSLLSQSKDVVRNIIIAKYQLNIQGAKPIKVIAKLLVQTIISDKQLMEFGTKAQDIFDLPLRHVTGTLGQAWRSLEADRLKLGTSWILSDGSIFEESALAAHPYGLLFKLPSTFDSQHGGGSLHYEAARARRFEDLDAVFGDDFDHDFDHDFDDGDDHGDDHDFGNRVENVFDHNAQPYSRRNSRHNSRPDSKYVPFTPLQPNHFRRTPAEPLSPSGNATLARCFLNLSEEPVFFASQGQLNQILGEIYLVKIKSGKELDRTEYSIKIDFPNIFVNRIEKKTEAGELVEVGLKKFFNVSTGVLSNTNIDQLTKGFPYQHSNSELVRRQVADPSLVYAGVFDTDYCSMASTIKNIATIKRMHGDILTIDNMVNVPTADVQTDVRVFSGAKVGVVAQFHFFDGKHRVNFALRDHNSAILASLYEGLGAQDDFFNLSPRRKDKNLHAAAPLIFGHRGIALYLIRRMAGIAIDGADAGLSRAELEHKIFKELDDVAIRSGASDVMTAVYTKRIVSDVKLLINLWLNEIENSPKGYCIVEKKIYEVDFNKKFYQFIYSLCQSIVEISGADCFTKKHSRSMPLKDYQNASLWGTDIEIPIDRATDRIGHFISEGVSVYIDNRPLERISAADFKTEMALGEKDGAINWFDLHPRTFFKGKEISMEDAVKFARGSLVEHEGKYFVVSKGSIPTIKWLDFFWSQVRQAKPTDKDEKEPHPIFAVPPNEVLNMLALSRAGIPIVGSQRWLEIEAAFDELSAREESSSEELTTAMRADLGIPLKDFQAVGTQWFLDHYKIEVGGILADEMGLGKTVQAIAFLKSLYLRGELGQVLVVVPTSLTFNWQREFLKFAPELPIAVFDIKTAFGEEIGVKSPKIWIASYGILAEHEKKFIEANATGDNAGRWNVVIFDEAQNLKNIRAVRTSSARALPAKIKFALTGTPMENHYGEFYSLVDLVAAGALGRYEKFMKVYGTQLTLKEGDSMLREQVGFLRLKTQPILLRRTKDRILTELPPKTETTIPLEFEKSQKKIYRDTAIAWNEKVQDLVADKHKSLGSQIHILTALMRLRQVCSFPGALPGIEYGKVPPKFEALLEALGELQQRKEPVIVFTNFKTTLDALEKYLNAAGILTLCLHGQVPAKKRQVILAEFEKCSEHVVLLMTQKVGGVGLNLTRASYVFHMEPWWNPAVENQATDRVHRIGQTRAVQVYRYIMTESVEEKIQLLKSRKSHLFGDLLNEETFDIGLVNDESTAGGTAASRANSISREDFSFLIDV